MLFFKKKKELSIDSFQWDTTGWIEQGVRNGDLVWTRETGDMAIQRFGLKPPTGIPFDWRDVEALRRYLLPRRPPTVASVSVDVLRLPAGVTCAQYVSKEFMPEPSLGFLYSGTVVMPFKEFFCNMLFICPEREAHGTRERALVSSGKVEMVREHYPELVNSREQLAFLYRELRRGAPHVTRSDDEQFDSEFPRHPLSRLRMHLKTFRETLMVDDAVKGQPPF